MATGRIGTTPVLTTRWSKAPAAGTTSLSGLDDNSVSLVYSVGYEQVYLNGALLSRTNDYTATNGTSITLTNATVAGDIVEVFANAVVPLTDTYTQSVANGKFINNTLTTTTGDIIYASAANTPARLGIGSTGQALTVSGGIPAWATLASGGWTLDSTTTLSGSSTSINLPSGYRELKIFIVNYNLSATAYPSINFNSDSGTNYAIIYMYGSTTGATAAQVADSALYLANGGTAASGANNNNAVLTLSNQDSTTAWKNYIMTDISQDTGGGKRMAFWAGFYRSTSAVTTIQIKAGAQTWSGGTVLVYGVK
jgi:hypothetical protein